MPPNAYTVRIAEEALRQVASISSCIACDSPEYAARWRHGIQTKMNSLSAFPLRNAIKYTKEQAGREVRETYFGVYRILYTVDSSTVAILTVRHGARRPLGPSEVAGID